MSYQPLRPARHELISVRGLKHRLTWWGEASRSPVMALHGFQDCGDTWQFVVDHLPAHWPVVAPDWRGFGGTEWAPGGYWFPDYLADLEALLDVLSPEAPARVIAHSMGANITSLYAGIRPQRLKWLVNLEGVGLPRTRPSDAPERYTRWLDELRAPLNEGRYGSVQQLAALIMKRNPRLPADRAEFVARAWTRDDATGVRLAFDPRHRLVNPILYRLEESAACWSRVAIPILLLAGGESVHRQRRGEEFSDQRLREFFPTAQLEILPGAGHMMHHEDPASVAQQIMRFAAGQESDPEHQSIGRSNINSRT